MHQRRLESLSDLSNQHLARFRPFVDDAVAAMSTELVQIRRHLHANPEPSGEEVETTKYLHRRLSEAGFEIHAGRGDVGLFADIGIGDPPDDAPLVAVRADIDALRLDDRKSTPYASCRSGVMHACGHDAHTTIALGVAQTVSRLSAEQLPSSLPGARFRLIFQPAEETAQGAQWMLRAGAMEGVSHILGVHVDPQFPAGDVGIRYGILTAHCDEVHITVDGRGGHAARPHDTSDPIATAAQLINTLYQSLPRSVDSRTPAVFTIGRVSGGQAPNVIPDRVELAGSLRTTDVETREVLLARIRLICHGIQLTGDNKVTVDFRNTLSAVRNDRFVMSAVEAACRTLVGNEHLHRIEKPSMGGEDFSVYLDRAPGAQLRLGCAGASAGADWPLLHSPWFDIDESSLCLGTRILTLAALLLTMETSPS